WQLSPADSQAGAVCWEVERLEALHACRESGDVRLKLRRSDLNRLTSRNVSFSGINCRQFNRRFECFDCFA
ncbi:MAG: hypothetical protein KDA47_15075, partial [Planctomycetales bacterium]|nr:hypothetical protein [Planctomycetales bacterium]